MCQRHECIIMSSTGLTPTTTPGFVGSMLMTLWLPESLRRMLFKVLISIALILTIRNEIPVHGTNIRLTQRNNHANISELLDNLLRGYDNSVRPDFGGKSGQFIKWNPIVWYFAWRWYGIHMLSWWDVHIVGTGTSDFCLMGNTSRCIQIYLGQC